MKKHIIEFTVEGEASFLGLPKPIRIQIEKKLRYFISSDNSLSYAKKLSGLENKFRFRIGDYRVVFAPQDQQTLVILLVLKVGHRRDIYF